MTNPLMRVATVLAVAMLATACQQERNNDAAAGPVRDVPGAKTSAATTAQPAQVPLGDASLPPRGTVADGSSGTEGAHSALTKPERDNALPLEGQTNSYSSDAFAKRGNEQIPRESPNSPRGDEAVSTPNSYPKDAK